LNQFFEFIRKREIPFNLLAVNQFLEDLKHEKRSPFTVNLYLAAVKRFTVWLLDEDVEAIGLSQLQLTDLAKILKIKALAVNSKTYHKDSLNEQQRDELIGGTTELKEKLLLSLQVHEGLRPSEPIGLQVKNIDLEAKVIRVTGKGKHTPDTIKLFSLSAQLLAQHIKAHKLQPNDFVFEGLKYFQVRRIAKNAFVRIGLKSGDKKLSPHSLRHTAAQIMYGKNISTDFLQRQMRHAHYKTTQVYTFKAVEQLFIAGMPDMI
jgi:integrase/recombinase XerC